MLRLSAVALAATLTVGLAGSTPTSAAEATSTDPVPWTMAPCATANLGGAVKDRSVDWFVMSGSAVQCAPVVVGGGVRIAVYPEGGETGHAAGYNVRLFDTAAAGVTREFGAAVVRPFSGEYGVCVLAGEHSRIACVRLTVAGDPPAATTRPIATTDPLVTKEVDTAPYSGGVHPPSYKGTDPTCGTCF